ncbi:P-loop containing nucleoside triphosphate hydrolase protein [Atractiella rhizophila]|nr:P-loop containing nucleoside triphosphate hydrolase protein [Atractiella rhizophila]
MSRKIPSSTKAKKAKLQAKRQQKRDGVPEDTPGPAARKVKNSKYSRGGRNIGKSYLDDPALVARQKARKALESRFIRLPKSTLDFYIRENSRKPLQRPVDPIMGKWREDWDKHEEGKAFVCPKRPKWNYEMSKKEVEKNEEGQFRRWLQDSDKVNMPAEQNRDGNEADEVTPSPSFFERNLSVWRQLWRVTEAAEILLVLLDVRCPLLHFPMSLQDHLRSLRPKKKVVLVLTKCDLVSEKLAEQWRAHFDDMFKPDGWRCVFLESYRTKTLGENTQANVATTESGISETQRTALMAELQRVHEELITPPKELLQDPDKLQRWKPRCRVQVDWLDRQGYYVEKDNDKDAPDLEDHETETVGIKPFLSIGLIGQPNVGKSSLLNSLVGRKVVKASKTPGKTKHFQTIFLNPTLRLVDCPGLVFPSVCGFELQVLGGIIPLQNIAPVMYFVCERLPLEQILQLPLRTQAWTTDDILGTYAESQGFITAKAGRPDIYRAGHAILRAMHAGAIKWAFSPNIQESSTGVEEGKEGIWLKEFQGTEIMEGLGEDHEHEEVSSMDESGEDRTADSSDDSEEEGSEEMEGILIPTTSAFSFLNVEGQESGEDDDEE